MKNRQEKPFTVTIKPGITRNEMIDRLNLAADILSKRPETNARDVVSCVLRNGRWGTCHRCPRDRAGALHPERCVNSDQKVHWSYYTNDALDSLLEALF